MQRKTRLFAYKNMAALPYEVLKQIIGCLYDVDRRQFRLSSLKNLNAYKIYVDKVKRINL